MESPALNVHGVCKFRNLHFENISPGAALKASHELAIIPVITGISTHLNTDILDGIIRTRGAAASGPLFSAFSALCARDVSFWHKANVPSSARYIYRYIDIVCDRNEA
jgi:hypothetical protein